MEATLWALERLDPYERVTLLNELAVLRDNRGDNACGFALDLVKDLHRLDNANYLASMHRISDFDEWIGGRRRRGVEDSGERRDDGDASLCRIRRIPGYGVRALRAGRADRGGNLRCRNGNRRIEAASQCDAHTIFGEIELADVSALQSFSERLHPAN